MRYTAFMQQSSVGSFLQSVLGFLLFIAVSFGITYVVNTLSVQHEAQAQQAAALQAMLRSAQ